MDFKCVVGLGVRCYTSIYLKELNLRKFSSTFDSLISPSKEMISDFLNGDINFDDMIHTKHNNKFDSLNKENGNRSIYPKYNNEKNDESYHYAVFAHYDMDLEKNVNHFKRCIDRFNIIKLKQIRTLFVITCHENNDFNFIPDEDDISYIFDNSCFKFNCHLLVIKFIMHDKKKHINNINISTKTENYTIVNVMNNSLEYSDQKNNLNKIFFDMFKLDSENLMNYADLE